MIDSTIEKYHRLLSAYDCLPLPDFLQVVKEKNEALNAVRMELEDVPVIDLDTGPDEIANQYRAVAQALALRQGHKAINNKALDGQLLHKAKLAEGSLIAHTISVLQGPVSEDLQTLDEKALSRLILLTDVLPLMESSLGLMPATGRLLPLFKLDGKSDILMAASLKEFDKAAKSDKRETLLSVQRNDFPYVSLSFIGSQADLYRRGLQVADLLSLQTP